MTKQATKQATKQQEIRLQETWVKLVPSKRRGRRNPAEVYLASLAESGRYTMRRKLRSVAALLLDKHESELPEDVELVAPWQALRYEMVTLVKTILSERGLAPATVNGHLYALRGVARESFNLGLMSGDELQRIQQVKPVQGTRLPAGRAIAAGELKALLRACQKDAGPAGDRDAALIALLYAGGLRRAEAVGLDVSDYDSEAGELVVRGKGNRERLLHINDGAADALADWLAIRGDEEGPLFQPVNKGGVLQRRRMTTQALYNVLRKRASQASVKDLAPHDLRRSFVSDLLAAGADIAVVQRLAGHANIQTTTRYDMRGEEVAKRAVTLLHVPYTRRRVDERKEQTSGDDSTS